MTHKPTPREPTQEMIERARYEDNIAGMWRAMWDAAPAPRMCPRCLLVRCNCPAPAPPAAPTSDELCARLCDFAASNVLDWIESDVALIREAAARIAAQDADIERLRDKVAELAVEALAGAAARVAALEADVKRARENAEWLYEQASKLDARAEAAEARCAELCKIAEKWIACYVMQANPPDGIHEADRDRAFVSSAIDAARNADKPTNEGKYDDGRA